MRSEWEKVKPENKGANSVEGLPMKTYARDKFILGDWEAKHVWFANILNNAVFKCNLNPKYSNTIGFKTLKNEKNFFTWNLSLVNIGSRGFGFYFEWPENITKEVNTIVSAAGKDQEIMLKALYMFIRDYMNKLPSSETSGTSISSEGFKRDFSIDSWDNWILGFAERILGQIDDQGIETLSKTNRYGSNVDWASGFPAFESVQSIKQLKYVQLYEGFVKNLKK